MYGPLTIQDYDGMDVVDAAGEKIGTVERSYDDDNGVVQLIEVRMGTIMRKHRIVPADGAEASDGRLQIPYTREAVEASPDASDLGDEVSGDALDQISGYWDSQPTTDVRSEDIATETADQAPDEESTPEAMATTSSNNTE